MLKEIWEFSIKGFPLRLIVIPLLVGVSIQLIMGNPSLSTSMDGNIANAFLGTVAQVLAGILAIAFSISVLAVEIYADKYTPSIFSILSRDKSTRVTLGILLLSILIFVSAMGIDTIPMRQWGFLLTNLAFAFCLLITFDYFFRVFTLLNPRYLVEFFESESLKELRAENSKDRSRNINLLGELAIDVLKQEKYEVAYECLRSLRKIYRHVSYPETHNVVEEIVSSILGVPDLIQRHYYEIFELAIGKSNNMVAEYILSQLFGMLSESEEQDKKSQLILYTIERVNEKIITTQNFSLWREEVRVFRQGHSLSVLTSLRNVFFHSARFAFCQQQFEYVKELFEFDQYDLDAKFLTYQPGICSWSDCYLQYYILCLAYALRRPKNYWYPQNSLDKNDEFMKSLPYFVGRVLEQYEYMLLQKTEWNDVFNGNFQEAIAKAQNWLLEISGSEKSTVLTNDTNGSAQDSQQGVSSWVKRLVKRLWRKTNKQK